MKVGLFITGNKSEYILENINFTPKFIVTYVDVNAKDISYHQIEKYCSEKNVPLILRKNIVQKHYDEVDKIFVIGWQYLLKDNLDKLITIHDSILPDYRGFCPVVNSLLNKEKVLGATAFRPCEEIDAGDVYIQKSTVIYYPIKLKAAYFKVSKFYVDIMHEIIETNPKPFPQLGSPTYSIWRDLEDLIIDWTQSADEIHSFVDALDIDYLRARTNYKNEVIYITDVKVVNLKFENIKGNEGKLWSLKNNQPIVLTGNNCIQILRAYHPDGCSQVKFNRLREKLK